MSEQLSKVYEPKITEQLANKIWEQGNFFHAQAADNRKAYCIVIPPPNVTAPLHLGHALNNTLQDILIRHRRMQGFNTLWMPGTDHAGIATQTVVEKRILAEEGRRRTDFSRQDFVERVQAWKNEYEAMIIEQLKAMGCSCDWQRNRFTMDEICAKAVRAAFFKLFSDGLIYRGKRLVNWDPATQTVLADDEVEHETIQGHFWYMRYPLVESVPCGTGFQPVESQQGWLCHKDQVQKRKGAYLPHWMQAGSTYAVNFRLADSIPASILEGWRDKRNRITQQITQQGREPTRQELIDIDHLYSERVESYLNAGQGKCHLKDERIAQLVQNALKHFNGQRYDLIAWVIMPNHVHVIVRPYEGEELSQILHSWKSYTATKANEILGLSGTFWQSEYYDHLIRDEEDFYHQVSYIVGNPSSAGLEEWPWVGIEMDKIHGQDARATTIEFVTVATTRPETMLGDTAVAMNPADPRAKYLVGKKVRLPIVGRIIPIIADEHVVLPNPESDDEKARFSTGFLKVTPAHDPDDWEIGLRHNLPVINIMAPDGSISDKFGWGDCSTPEAQSLLGLDRFEAREAIVEWFRKENLLEETKDYTHDVGHSYRSHVPIEPYLSDQWYIAVKKPIEQGGTGFQPVDTRLGYENTAKRAVPQGFIEGTDVPINSLAGLALKPLLDNRLQFIPERYANTYKGWLENLRDWPISRQLWWGHQIPIWYCNKCQHISSGLNDITKCEKCGSTDLTQDNDVLDTWFSSALWPFSTMGWPEQTAELKKFYPTDVLCTAREIITLWVSRMVMMGQYCVGDIPFNDVYIHAMIQDGEGRKMSKSLGNGIDPLTIIDSHGADAMRFTLASMTTETQDIRMPVVSMKLPDGRQANTSPKFDTGRNFCNKLWNASRFAMMNLEGVNPDKFDKSKLTVVDRWILSRLAETISQTTEALEKYQFSEPLSQLYKFFWNDFCDWFLEWIKPRLRDEQQKPIAQNVLAFVLDQTLRLLHPFVPFITEGIFQKLNEIAPVRKLNGLAEAAKSAALVTADWPKILPHLLDEQAEKDIDLIQKAVSTVRDIRSNRNIPPKELLKVSIETLKENADILNINVKLIEQLAGVKGLEAGISVVKPDNATVSITDVMAIYFHYVQDIEAERAKLQKQKEQIETAKKAVEEKLANENFVAKARPQVVKQAKEKLSELAKQLKTIEKHLRELDGR
jgi:valyl-tRNA synthetase